MQPGSTTIVPIIRKVSIIGLGKLGIPMTAAIASSGIYVIGVDSDKSKIESISNKKCPIFESGVQQLFDKWGWYISAESRIESAVQDTDATFVVVATPSLTDGSFSLEYILPVVEKIGEAIKLKDSFHIVVITSTVMPGHTDGPIREILERISGKKAGVDFGLCYNPEFIALGSVIHDFQYPDMVLIGESDKLSGDVLFNFYDKVTRHSCPVKRMKSVNAEIAKLAINTYITTKITYANMLGTLCQGYSGADVDVVTDAVGTDSRIGKKYLKAGASYGGPCFPRDNLALTKACEDTNTSSLIPEGTHQENEYAILDIVKIIKEKKSLTGILGFTYKPNTNVTENSFGSKLWYNLVAIGIFPVMNDPNLEKSNLLETVLDCDLIVIATLHPEFEKIPDEKWHNKTIIDPWRQYKRLKSLPGVKYIGLGLG